MNISPCLKMNQTISDVHARKLCAKKNSPPICFFKDFISTFVAMNKMNLNNNWWWLFFVRN